MPSNTKNGSNQHQQVTLVQLTPLVPTEANGQQQGNTGNVPEVATRQNSRRSNRNPNRTAREETSDGSSTTGKVAASGGLFLFLMVAFFLVKVLITSSVNSSRYSGTSIYHDRHNTYDSSSNGEGWSYGSTQKRVTQPPSWSYIFPPQPKQKVGTCSNSACILTVKDLLNSRNISVDPCDNFYEYACRGWENNNHRPSYMPKWGTFRKLESETNNIVRGILEVQPSYGSVTALNTAKRFYRSCRDVGSYNKRSNGYSWPERKVEIVNDTEAQDAEMLKPMWNTLEKYGGWPLLYQGSWQDSPQHKSFNWMQSVVDLKRLFGRSEILDINTYQDFAGRKEKNAILMKPPSAQTGSYKFGLVQLKEIQRATTSVITWQNLIVNISKELLVSQGMENINETYLEDRAMDILFVHSQLVDLEDIKIPLEMYGLNETVGDDEISLDKLQKIVDDSLLKSNHTNQVNLHKLLETLYANTKVKIVKTDNVLVSDLNYILAISEFLTVVKPEALANYLHFQMAVEMASMTTRKMQGFVDTMRNTLYGTSGARPKSSVCTSIVQDKFSVVVSQAYLKSRYPNIVDILTDLVQIRQIFNDVKKVISKQIESTNLPFYNKTILELKLNLSDFCIGLPPDAFFDYKVQAEYAGLFLNHSASFLEQYMHVTAWSTDKMLNVLREAWKDECKWDRSAASVGAFNKVWRFLIYLPLGMMQPPFYNLDFPKALTYAKIGSILGHELVHSLVGTGWTITKNGSMTPTAECFVRQYSNYTIKELQNENITLNGELTLTENIPDNVGLLGAYRAYKNWYSGSNSNAEYLYEEPMGSEEYSDSQLFFLGFAQNFCDYSTPESMRRSVRKDKHSPGMFRVLGTLKNSKEFSEAWNCPVGSAMNPAPKNNENKCSMF